MKTITVLVVTLFSWVHKFERKSQDILPTLVFALCPGSKPTAFVSLRDSNNVSETKKKTTVSCINFSFPKFEFMCYSSHADLMSQPKTICLVRKQNNWKLLSAHCGDWGSLYPSCGSVIEPSTIVWWLVLGWLNLNTF